MAAESTPCLADRAKAKVLDHYPLAQAVKDIKYQDWAVYRYGEHDILGFGTTESDAWLDAAARLL